MACGFPKTTWVGQNYWWAGSPDYSYVAKIPFTDGVVGWFGEIENIEADAVCPLKESGLYGVIGHFAQVSRRSMHGEELSLLLLLFSYCCCCYKTRSETICTSRENSFLCNNIH